MRFLRMPASAIALSLICAPAHPQDIETAKPLRIELSVEARRLWAISGDADTVYTAPVAVGSGRTLRTRDRTWKFTTPLGATTVLAKETNPVWIPPDWHYVETANTRGLALEHLTTNDTVVLRDGRLLVVRALVPGVVGADSTFRALPGDTEIVFGNTLFVPPFGSAQRRIAGMLGPYRLLLANGVGLHGTPYAESIGKAATHGCVRLRDPDVTWLYENVPVGTRVEIRR